MGTDKRIIHTGNPDTLGDVLERILDKGVVIAGDISVSIADIELLTIRIRLIVASVEKAMEMGIDWWTFDPMLSSHAKKREIPARENATELPKVDG